ncbi:MAG: hypothetical protein LUG83_02065 [Lachnospiraceae bacterium]|nr:hypothetical protein [Lachnospiraceae bacterium]
MNCCWIFILLLLCNGGCGSNSNGCSCGSLNGNIEDSSDNSVRGRNEEKGRDRDCGCNSGAMPSAWSRGNDCGCDNGDSRGSSRQDFPGIGRGDSCGCDNNSCQS